MRSHRIKNCKHPLLFNLPLNVVLNRLINLVLAETLAGNCKFINEVAVNRLTDFGASTVVHHHSFQAPAQVNDLEFNGTAIASERRLSLLDFTESGLENID